jgi:hypothetical protein
VVLSAVTMAFSQVETLFFDAFIQGDPSFSSLRLTTILRLDSKAKKPLLALFLKTNY